MELVNTLPENLTSNVNYSREGNIIAWNNLDFFCNNSGVEDIFGFVVYLGHYTPLNISLAGSPLTLHAPAEISCVIVGFEPFVLRVLLSPQSDSAEFFTNAG